MGNISSLEAKILALQKGEKKTRQAVIEVEESLIELGFKGFHDGSCNRHGRQGGVIGGEPGGQVTLWDCGCWQHQQAINEKPKYKTLLEAVTASLQFILLRKVESLKMRNRQIRDLRRSLK